MPVTTGWLAVANATARVELIEVLLSMPNREFNKSELARIADVARTTVYEHWDRLEQLNLIEPTEHAVDNRYTVNTDSEVYQCLVELDAAANRAGPEAPEVCDE